MAANRVSSFSKRIESLDSKIVKSSVPLLPLLATCQIAAVSLAPTTSAQTYGPPEGTPWKRHAIDSSSRGADGIRIADINGDGLWDLTTGWEEGGRVSVYINPGPKKSRNPWPKVIVGNVPSPEDAVFIDLNSDGRLDVVSSTEGKERTVYAHLAPNPSQSLSSESGWKTLPFPATVKRNQWMFALPLQIDGRYGDDLALGSKGANAQICWLQAPKSGSDLDAWRLRKLCDAGWIMSLKSKDMDSDGDLDILLSDRKGSDTGIWWLENPGPEKAASFHWPRRYIAGSGKEVMFLDTGDINGDGLEDIVAAVKGGDFVAAIRLPSKSPSWQETTLPYPSGTGTGKAVAIGDIDQNGKADIVATCEHSEKASGVFWIQENDNGEWSATEISGAIEGVKFDRIETIDLDGDGDLDVITCEERDNLGVIWYENPLR